MNDATSLAQEVNASRLAERLHPLAPWEIAAIEADQRTRELRFIGRGVTDQEATAIAEGLRKSFLDEQPFTGVLDIERQLQSLASRISELRRLIALATSAPPPPQPGQPEFILAAQLSSLDAQIGALLEQYNTLAIELLNPVLRSSAEIEADMAEILNLYVLKQLERQALDPTTEFTPEEDGTETTTVFSEEALQRELQITFWQIESDQLETAYRELFLRKVELQSLVDIQPTQTRESTLEEVSPITNQTLALVAGLLVGILGLIVADRVRKPLWSALEIEGMTKLPEIQPRGWIVPADRPWYTATPPGQRKAGMQALRSIIEGIRPDAPITIGIAGVEVYPEDIQELAADLAASFAVSASSALLIDANFENPSDLAEFGTGYMTLSQLLSANVEPGVLSETLERRMEVMPGLKALRAGRASADAADFLAQPRFTALLDSAKSDFGVVIVAGADVSSPVTQILSQRLDLLILLGGAGHTTEAELAAAEREFGERRARLLGMVLLLSRPTRLRRAISRAFGGRRASKHAAQEKKTAGVTQHEPAKPPVASVKPSKVEAPVQQTSGAGAQDTET
jgi:Mrp family chromosome partitioning ATPase